MIRLRREWVLGIGFAAVGASAAGTVQGYDWIPLGAIVGFFVWKSVQSLHRSMKVPRNQ